jgi:hypothetical protein
MSRCKFTWTNSRSVLTCENLDRVLASTEWERSSPSHVEALNREISDHMPFLFLCTIKSFSDHRREMISLLMSLKETMSPKLVRWKMAY